MTCWPCERPGDYDYRSMGMFSEWNKLCDACKEKFSKMKPPYVLKEPEEAPKKQFLPKQIDVKRHWTEREPGSDDV